MADISLPMNNISSITFAWRIEGLCLHGLCSARSQHSDMRMGKARDQRYALAEFGTSARNIRSTYQSVVENRSNDVVVFDLDSKAALRT